MTLHVFFFFLMVKVNVSDGFSFFIMLMLLISNLCLFAVSFGFSQLHLLNAKNAG